MLLPAYINAFSAGSLYAHTAAKVLFVRLFRHTRHIYTHTVLGWFVWCILCLGAVAIAFILAIAVPIFSYLIGISAALFASWYTYGVAGFFWLHDVYKLKGGSQGLQRQTGGLILAVLTIIAGGFICVTGTYVSIKVSYKFPASENMLILLVFCLADQRCIWQSSCWEAVFLLMMTSPAWLVTLDSLPSVSYVEGVFVS